MRVVFAGLVSALCAGACLLPGCGDNSDGDGGAGTGGASAVSGGTGGASAGTSAVSGGTGTNTGGVTSASGGVGAKGGSASGATGGKAMAGAPSGGGSAGGTATGGKGGGGAATGGAGVTGGSSSGGGGNPTPSSGCGKADAITGLLANQELEIEGAARTYQLSVPADYDADRAYPLVFAWHGLGGSGTLARQYFGIERQSKGGAIFVYPDGLENDEGNAGWDLGANGVDVALFDALVESVTAAYCVDEQRIFSTGHSFGGFMTERLGCSRADVLRAIAPVAGGPPFGGSTNCTTSIAAWITHGSNDATVDFETGQAGLELWLETNGCETTTQATEPEPCVAYEGCSEPVHWCVHEQNHNWPNFAAEGIWAFFSAQN